jgi:hypothetical protein
VQFVVHQLQIARHVVSEAGKIIPPIVIAKHLFPRTAPLLSIVPER